MTLDLLATITILVISAALLLWMRRLERDECGTYIPGDTNANVDRCKWWIDTCIERGERAEYICTLREYDEWVQTAEKVLSWCGAECGWEICEHELLVK